MKFLCDQMLIKLGRWLRVAGYATKTIEKSLDDHIILEISLSEQRFLLTRDHHFVERKKGRHCVIWLASNSLKECVKELSEKIPIDWLKNPLSRCLLCNELLIKIKSASNYEIPKDILDRGLELLFCQHCQKVFWQGSHTKRMLTTLREWQCQRFNK